MKGIKEINFDELNPFQKYWIFKKNDSLVGHLKDWNVRYFDPDLLCVYITHNKSNRIWVGKGDCSLLFFNEVSGDLIITDDSGGGRKTWELTPETSLSLMLTGGRRRA